MDQCIYEQFVPVQKDEKHIPTGHFKPLCCSWVGCGDMQRNIMHRQRQWRGWLLPGKQGCKKRIMNIQKMRKENYLRGFSSLNETLINMNFVCLHKNSTACGHFFFIKKQTSLVKNVVACQSRSGVFLAAVWRMQPHTLETSHSHVYYYN